MTSQGLSRSFYCINAVLFAIVAAVYGVAGMITHALVAAALSVASGACVGTFQRSREVPAAKAVPHPRRKPGVRYCPLSTACAGRSGI